MKIPCRRGLRLLGTPGQDPLILGCISIQYIVPDDDVNKDVCCPCVFGMSLSRSVFMQRILCYIYVTRFDH